MFSPSSRKHNLQVKQIVITHAHIDHVGGAMKLRAATGAPILLNQNDYALLKMLDVQAAWIGMEDPGKVEIDQSIGAGGYDAGWAADRERHCTRPDTPKAAFACIFPQRRS
jgi:glyoxylase-like metal-dependent hydrolase (beta-lactamase superfamily II)